MADQQSCRNSGLSRRFGASRGGALTKQLARMALRLVGWRIEGATPRARCYVLVGAPHTSRWDLPLMLLLARAADLPVRWFAKHMLFLPPLGWLLRALGGVPVVRHRSENLVEVAAEALRNAEALALLVAPEATKAPRDHWKSGFYRIALQASVPVVPAALDYGRRVATLGPELEVTDDVQGLMDRLRHFYAGREARVPGKFGDVRLEEENADLD
jgi:1-acyl-sn-glycerol-3-phosphate acyltransferase